MAFGHILHSAQKSVRDWNSVSSNVLLDVEIFCNCCISLVFEDQLIKTRRWCSEMKVWIGHLVSPIRPTLCPQPSLSGQQTNTATSLTLLQHYNRRHLYNWLFEQRYNVLRLLRRPRCIIPGDSIATFGGQKKRNLGRSLLRKMAN